MINVDLIGYIYAIIASLFFAFYIIPKKLTKQKPLYYSFFMGIGFVFGSTFIYFIYYFISNNAETFINKFLFLSIIAWILRAIWSIFLLSSIDKIGLARSNQWKNLQWPIGVILSLIILSEFIQTNTIFALIAGLNIFISALFLNIKHESEKKINAKGIRLAIFSAILFGIVTVLNKFVTDNSWIYAQLVVWSMFTFATIWIYIFTNNKLRKALLSTTKKDMLLGILGWLLYAFAGFFMLKSYSKIPASIWFTIIQLNALWVITIGIIYFKEIDYKKNRLKILFGIIFAVMGVIFLVYAKK